MISKNLYMRFRHAQKRPHDAWRRFFRRSVLRLLNVDFSKQTEIQYVELGLYDSAIISKYAVTPAREIKFQTGSSIFVHNFDSKFVIEISNVLVNTETNHIYVSEKSKNSYKFLKESSSWPTEQVLFNSERPKYKSIKRIERASLGLPSSGFYHWLSEDLSDFLIYQTELPVLNYKNSNIANQEVMEVLEKTTIQCDKWVIVEELTFVTKGQDLGYIHPVGAQFLKKFASSNVPNKQSRNEKIYVSRSKSRRSIPSENAIENYLLGRGFRIVHAEGLTFFDQVEIFSSAKLVVGIHGAGLSHALWPENCNLIELMPINRVNRCFEWQTLICEGDYQLIYFNPDLPAETTLIPQLDLLNL
jgi:hypothetical protein